MKKFLLFLCAVMLVFGMVGSAMAIPTTWTDTQDWNPDQYIGWYASFDYSLDIGNDGFVGLLDGGDDCVTSYSLTVALHDDGGRWDGAEIAFIDQPGLIGDGFYDFSYSSQTYGWSVAGLIDITVDGTLNVSIDSCWGDFYLDSSTVVAQGDNGAAPVPEPSTILLLGLGLIGMVGYGRKRFSKKG